MKKLGHSDEEIEEVIKSETEEEAMPEEEPLEVEEEVEVEATPEEDAVGEGEDQLGSQEPEPLPVETTSPEGEEVAPSEEVEVPAEEGEVAEELPAEELPPVESEPLPEGVEEVSPDAPMVDETPTEPVQSGVDVQALLGQIEEYKKANDGLQARVDALESALKEAGVLGEGSLPSKEVGVDDGTRTDRKSVV